METFILIDNDQLCFLKATESLEQAQYWADILASKHDYYITTVESKKAFSVYTDYELRLLYKNTTGEPVPDTTKYTNLISGLQQLAQNLDVDETSLAGLKKQLGHSRKEPTTEPTPERKGRKPAQSGEPRPLKRPKEGSATGKVWDIADELNAKEDAIPSRQDVIDAATAAGINSSTASTQYGKWKKHLNNAAG